MAIMSSCDIMGHASLNAIMGYAPLNAIILSGLKSTTVYPSHASLMPLSIDIYIAAGSLS